MEINFEKATTKRQKQFHFLPKSFIDKYKKNFEEDELKVFTFSISDNLFIKDDIRYLNKYYSINLNDYKEFDLNLKQLLLISEDIINKSKFEEKILQNDVDFEAILFLWWRIRKIGFDFNSINLDKIPKEIISKITIFKMNKKINSANNFEYKILIEYIWEYCMYIFEYFNFANNEIILEKQNIFLLNWKKLIFEKNDKAFIKEEFDYIIEDIKKKQKETNEKIIKLINIEKKLKYLKIIIKSEKIIPFTNEPFGRISYFLKGKDNANEYFDKNVFSILYVLNKKNEIIINVPEKLIKFIDVDNIIRYFFGCYFSDSDIFQFVTNDEKIIDFLNDYVVKWRQNSKNKKFSELNIEFGKKIIDFFKITYQKLI